MILVLLFSSIFSSLQPIIVNINTASKGIITKFFTNLPPLIVLFRGKDLK